MQWTTGIVSAISKTSDITEVSTPDGDFGYHKGRKNCFFSKKNPTHKVLLGFWVFREEIKYLKVLYGVSKRNVRLKKFLII